jgi:hypothetical protein
MEKTKINRKIKTRLEKFQEQKFLLLSLIGSGFAVLIAEYFGKEIATIFTDLIYIPITATLVVLSIVSLRGEGFRGNHGKAWIIFSVFAICWFVAETLWTANELVYHTKPFPSSADFFFLIGYPAYFAFSLFYLRPVIKGISKKMTVIACLIAISVLIPNLYMTINNSSNEDQFAIALGEVYPIADAIVLVPSLLGVALFLGGKVNFLWTLMLIGIFFNVAADTGFQYYSLDNSYYSGHPIDILFLWGFIVFSFGVYNYIKIFKKDGSDHRYLDQENMR